MRAAVAHFPTSRVLVSAFARLATDAGDRPTAMAAFALLGGQPSPLVFRTPPDFDLVHRRAQALPR